MGITSIESSLDRFESLWIEMDPPDLFEILS